MPATATRKNVAKSVRFAAAMDSLMDTPSQTRSDLDLFPVYVEQLLAEGLIKVDGKVTSGRRGRPAHTFRLTDKARKRVKSARARAAKA